MKIQREQQLVKTSVYIKHPRDWLFQFHFRFRFLIEIDNETVIFLLHDWDQLCYANHGEIQWLA